MAYTREHIKGLARSYIDLYDHNRVASFDDWCRARGGFQAGDYHRIKAEIKKRLQNRPCSMCDLKKESSGNQ